MSAPSIPVSPDDMAKWSELLEAARGWRNQFSDRDELAWANSPQFARDYALVRAIRAFDPPKPKRHVFGGVVFEETGCKTSRPEVGTWFFGRSHGPQYVSKHATGFDSFYPILKPLGLVGEVDDA